jgi:hypothetical protein
MNRKAAQIISLQLLLTFVLLSPPRARASDPLGGTVGSMGSMGSVEQYLMDRDAEITLARSAAPPSVSADATVLVLTTHGFETAMTGKNGWVCLVDRSWTAGFNDPRFWTPTSRGPGCFNPQAVRSIVPILLKRNALALAGHSRSEIAKAMKAAVENKELPVLEPGAMSYMMSRDQRLGDGSGPWVPHLMFYLPKMDTAAWGSDQPGTPVFLNAQFNGAPEPVTVFMVAVDQWSDGTLVNATMHQH